jgi:uncharacterized membrane protein HdeD (DUF308 family)
MEFQTFVYAAILVEGIVNIVRELKNGEKDWRYWASLVIAIGLSILVAYNWDLDLFSEILGDGKIPLVGAVLTGLVFSRGSNYLADLVKLLGAFTNRIKNGF